MVLGVQADLEQGIRDWDHTRGIRKPRNPHELGQGGIVQPPAEGLEYLVACFTSRLQNLETRKRTFGKDHGLPLQDLQECFLSRYHVVRPGAQVLVLEGTGSLPGIEV